MNLSYVAQQILARKGALIVTALACLVGLLWLFPSEPKTMDPKSQAKRAERAIGSSEESYAQGNVAAGRELLKEAVRLEAAGKQAEADSAYLRAVEQFSLATEIANGTSSKRTLRFRGDAVLGEVYTRASLSGEWINRGPAKGSVTVQADVDVRIKCSSAVDDAMLDGLADLPPASVQSLVLGETKVTDAGLKKCLHLHGLTDVALYSTRVGDEGVLGFAALPSIKHLNLSGTQVGDAIIDGLLAKLPVLESLNLENTDISPALLPVITGHKSLTLLFLPTLCSNDAGIQAIASMKQLKWLKAEGRHVTDASVDVLLGFTELKHLILPGTRLSDESLSKLRKGLPDCKVLY